MITQHTPGAVLILITQHTPGPTYTVLNDHQLAEQKEIAGIERQRANNLEDQRDALLAALHQIADLESEIGDSHRYRYAGIARAAIAAVNGST